MRYRLRRLIEFDFIKKRIIMLLTFVLIVALSISIWIYNSVFPKNGGSILKSKAISDITQNITETVNNYMTDNKKETVKILSPIIDGDGKITSYSADVIYIEKARYEVTESVINRLQRDSKVSTKIRLGSLTGNSYFTGKGLNVTIRGNTVCAVTSEVHTETVSIGINQALYKVSVNIKVDCKLFVGENTENFSVTTKHILAERLIFGEVPLA